MLLRDAHVCDETVSINDSIQSRTLTTSEAKSPECVMDGHRDELRFVLFPMYSGEYMSIHFSIVY